MQNRQTLFRSQTTHDKYITRPADKKCFICDKTAHTVVKEYKHWVIIENNYPYDELATVHHMLCPKRHMPFTFENEFTKEEAGELWMIRYMLNKEGLYDSILENFTAGQSHPAHVHYHLLKWKTIEQ